MTAAIRIHLVAFLATLLGAFTMSPIWAAPESPTPVHTYNAPADSATRDTDALKRGPPAARDMLNNRDTVDRWSHGASARPDLATPPAITNYDHPTPLVQVASAATTTREQAQATDGPLVSLQRGYVAANTAVSGPPKSGPSRV